MTGLEGLVFALLFYPLLAPALIVAAVGTGLATNQAANPIPSTPLAAARQRIGEVFTPLLISSAVASVIKISAPSLPDSYPVQVVVALLTGAIVGNRSGVAIVTAIAIAVHFGGFFPAVVCIAAAAGRNVVLDRRQLKAETT